MKQQDHMTRDVFSLINVAEVTQQINGGVWENKIHSAARDKTNVVVMPVALTNSQVQSGYVSIKITSPNLELKHRGVVDSTFPNKPEFYRIRDLILPLVDNVFRPTFNLSVEDATELLQDKDGNWFLLITLEYQSIQENFKKI